MTIRFIPPKATPIYFCIITCAVRHTAPDKKRDMRPSDKLFRSIFSKLSSEICEIMKILK